MQCGIPAMAWSGGKTVLRRFFLTIIMIMLPMHVVLLHAALFDKMHHCL